MSVDLHEFFGPQSYPFHPAGTGVAHFHSSVCDSLVPAVSTSDYS